MAVKVHRILLFDNPRKIHAVAPMKKNFVYERINSKERQAINHHTKACSGRWYSHFAGLRKYDWDRHF